MSKINKIRTRLLDGLWLLNVGILQSTHSLRHKLLWQPIFREEEAIKLDGLSVAEIKQLREKAEKHQFQAEVNRMMVS